MSSTYRILCLSHDPALVLEQEYSSGRGGREAVEAAVLAGVKDHEGCDLLLGRFSYPLIEVGCPKGPSCTHRGAVWLDTEWLQLLAAVGDGPHDEQLHKAVARARRTNRCWTEQRLNRLRLELDLS
jgi:hypothetical protein